MGHTSFTTAAGPLSASAMAPVLDALGREGRQPPLLARAATVALDMPSRYLVQAGGTARLVVA